MGSIPQDTGSLRILIVGAGIAGITCAVALRQAGHTVQLLERSAFSNSEVGAAINVTPNGARILLKLGFDFERALAYRVTGYEFFKGETLQRIDLFLGVPVIEPGTWAVLRADLHGELMRLAKEEGEGEHGSNGWGPPVELSLGAKVSSVTSAGESAEIVLENGERLSADIVVGADGAHSVVRSFVVGQEQSEEFIATHSGLAAFRFLIDTDKIRADEELAPWVDRALGTVSLIADLAESTKERNIIWYGCHGNALQNFVGIHPSNGKDIEESEELRGAMMQEYDHFHPSIKKMIGMADHLKRWPLYIHEPLTTWVRDRVVLIGDAVHPMLPFGAQGANTAIEDGAALGLLLQNTSQNDVGKSLSKFESIRKNRAARVQILSSVRAGREAEVQEKVLKYMDSSSTKPPTSQAERSLHDWGYDIFEEVKKVFSM